MPKKSMTVVVMERFTTEHEGDDMLLRISGGGIAEERQDELYDALADIDDIDVTITRWYVGIEKESMTKWSTIIPAVKKALNKFFDKKVHIIKRMRRTMPEKISTLLGKANLDLIRDTMEDCALTEDECDALGIDFVGHHLNIIDPCD